jgi:CxxC motif-containing protein (DUF1111 family)
MNSSGLARLRRRIAWGLGGMTGLWLVWVLTPGLPVWGEPRARAELKAVGLQLFEHEWQPGDPLAQGDGLGPVFNARSCVACHFQGGVGGGGGNESNVLAFEALPVRGRTEVRGGLIHKFAIDLPFKEGSKSLHDFFPVVPGGIRVEANCRIERKDFDPIQLQSINSTALFGAGWIDRIPAKTITHNSLKTSVVRVGRELQSDFRAMMPGRPRVLADGRVGKFGWKAQFATLEEFVAAACANELGLGNPRMNQARPMVRHPYPDVEPDLTGKQFRALVSFVDTLPRPTEFLPDDKTSRHPAERGKLLFEQVGCAYCHTPDLGGVAGVYSDFLLHRIEDPGKGGYRETPDVPLPHDYPQPEEWKTPPLWGVADSAPYFHDGGAPTLEAAIARHRGDAQNVTEAFKGLPTDDRDSILTFLKGLKAPRDAKPVPNAPKSDLALVH